MLDLLRKNLESLGALSGDLPDIIERVTEAIPFPTVPDRMKYTIAVNEVILYASQFRRNIQTWDNSSVPINSVGFVITGSGQNKDSSVNAARRCFSIGYDIINDKRKALAKRSAIRQASEAGVEPPYTWDTYKAFYREPNPLFVAPSTTEGFIQHLNDLDNDGIGSGFLYSGEFGAELSMSPVFGENLKLISEVYDLGNKEVKVLKARENQSREIRGLPVSAFFVGSPDNLLYDESIKRKFRMEFSTKLARRSFFCFVPQIIPEPDFLDQPDPIQAMFDYADNLNLISQEARNAVFEGVRIITEHNLAKAGEPLAISDEVRRLFTVYQRYNSELASTLPKLYSISMLVRKHLQWKALKLSGAIAIFNQHDVIEQDDYIQAIRFCELLDTDMQMFENELVKEPYEVFADYMKSIAENGKSFISLHNLRKLGYIPTGAGKNDQRMKDLIHLASSYDQQGIYTYNDYGIEYELIQPVANIFITYKPIDNTPIYDVIKSNGTKDQLTRAKCRVAESANSDLISEETTFAALADLLHGDFAYSPFRFKDGIRTKDNILPGTKWLVLDVDYSLITYEEAHLLLEDLNHHIALSSDASNPFKFRILLELDSVVDVTPQVWKYFYQSIADSLAIRVDPLPQSQLFYSYSTSPVLSTTDASPIAIRNHIMAANDRAVDKPVVEKPLTTAQVTAAINDPLTTFHYAYECPNDGSGSRTLMRAAYHARDLGMTSNEIVDLINDINDYWVQPMSEERLERTIFNQVRRF